MRLERNIKSLNDIQIVSNFKSRRTLRNMESILEALETELCQQRCELGDNHPDVADTLNTLGLMNHHVYGDHEKALNFHRAALNIYNSQESINKYHLHAGITYADIGNVLWKMNLLSEALSSFSQAHRILVEKANVDRTHPVLYSIKRRFSDRIDFNRITNIDIMNSSSTSSDIDESKQVINGKGRG